MYAQEFNVQVTSDTILAGNILNITFTANNIAGQFEGPDMQGLNVISGPNTSTSMSMINGDVTQTATYSYGVLCENIGDITILPAYFNTERETLETEPFSILVLPNPEGIIEQPPSNSGFFEFNFPRTTKKPMAPSTPKKKKRKLKKI
ncbi:MAG: hypothetical protein ACJATI_000752 [Halioglobus sp.]|jgi:hypothetical protein